MVAVVVTGFFKGDSGNSCRSAIVKVQGGASEEEMPPKKMK